MYVYVCMYVCISDPGERAGENPLTETEGQTRLSSPAKLNVHVGTERISAHVLFYFFLLEYYILSEGLVWWN